MLDIKKAAEKLTAWLKQSKMQNLVCNSCGYSQGHPIKYCPKCPGKMQFITYSEYSYFIKLRRPHDSLWYKVRCASLLEMERLTMLEWHDIVEEILKTERDN